MNYLLPVVCFRNIFSAKFDVLINNFDFSVLKIILHALTLCFLMCFKMSFNWIHCSESVCAWCGLAVAVDVNTLRPRQNGRYFADDIFKSFFLNENVWISIKFSLKFVPKGPINNNPALVQIMVWRRSGDKPLSEPMMVSLLTHICVNRLNELRGKKMVLVCWYLPFHESQGDYETYYCTSCIAKYLAVLHWKSCFVYIIQPK